MQLRASALLGTDLVALAIWPDDDPETGTGIDLGTGRDSAGSRGDGMPVEARCVDAALEGRQERAARGLLRWLVTRAQRHQQG